MWVCPHRSVSCINYGTYTCRSLKYQQNILDIIPHSLVPRLPCSNDFALWVCQFGDETQEILLKPLDFAKRARHDSL